MTENRTPALPPLTLGNTTWEYSPDVHGWTIKTTATHRIDVCRLLFHYRLVLTPLSSTDWWEHGWCYSGDEQNDLLHAVIAAVAWNPDEDAEPFGWSKRACECVRELQEVSR